MPIDSPYTKKRFAQYRGPTTSDDYNKRIEENYKDLTVLFNRVRLSEVELSEFFRRMAKDQLALTDKLNYLEQLLSGIENDNSVLTFRSTEQVDNDRFNETVFEISESDRLKFDTRHGLVLLPKVESSSLSKLLFTDTSGSEVLPPTLETRVVGNTSTADGLSATVDTVEASFAFYTKPGLVWERNVVVDAPHINGAEMTLYIKVPTDLYTTDKSNCIVIHPYPHFGTTIKEVAYTLNVDPLMRDEDGYEAFNSQGYYSGEDDAVGWVIPGGWTGGHTGQDAVVQSGPKAFYFTPKAITGLRIKLYQPNYYVENDRFIYSYGLSFFDLRYDKFLPEGKAMIRFDAPDGSTISQVDNVSADIWNVSPTDIDPNDPDQSHFSWRAIWETYPDSGVYTDQPVSSSNRVWIELTLREINKTPPALSSLTVEYS